MTDCPVQGGPGKFELQHRCQSHLRDPVIVRAASVPALIARFADCHKPEAVTRARHALLKDAIANIAEKLDLELEGIMYFKYVLFKQLMRNLGDSEKGRKLSIVVNILGDEDKLLLARKCTFYQNLGFKVIDRNSSNGDVKLQLR